MIPMTDSHMHTFFSTDSDAPPEAMAAQAVRLGLSSVCLTDHYDMGYPGGEFQLDTPAYARAVESVRESCRGKLDVRFGVELGLQPGLAADLSAYVSAWPFDQVIGSVHLLFGKDPYYPDSFPEWEDEGLYRAYFRQTAETVRAFHDFDILGHLDYMVRYGKEQGKRYSYAAFADELDEILRLLIRHGIALEINTGGLRAGLGFCHPHPDVLKRYRELGGERITFGSDAHAPSDVGYGFREARELAKSLGFRYGCVFRKRNGEEILL